ncbi:hypothetical protein IPH92_02390 [Candidatus Kaiserbacteria bacterium]|nr:MAG: hypothetical protein IPH92_02390 [Candidatus Kaiserbacteria bacterium]
MTLEEFKKLCADDIKNLPEKEVESLFRISTSFANFAYKKWIEQKVLNQK